jgi:hypothetical protein
MHALGYKHHALGTRHQAPFTTGKYLIAVCTLVIRVTDIHKSA